jgi:hypothetical protein
MKKTYFLVFITAFIVLATLPRLRAQQNPAQTQTKDQSGMTGMNMGDTQHDSNSSPQDAVTANEQMSEMHMDMGPHMRMTAAWPPSPDDEKRAEAIIGELKPAIEKYKDYQAALNDGFKIFHPEIPQEHYHFTSWSNAIEAQFSFNPKHPTSLLYKKIGGGYELEGAMYTAPRQYTEQQLNERVPLSVARWHEHVNLCLPPKGTELRQVNFREFGLRGSIATEDACDTAGGRWIPIIFNWMVHVYPYETDPAKIWAH